MTSGCRGTPYFRRHDRELVLKPTISLKKSRGGATVERLVTYPPPRIIASSTLYRDVPPKLAKFHRVPRLEDVSACAYKNWQLISAAGMKSLCLY